MLAKINSRKVVQDREQMHNLKLLRTIENLYGYSRLSTKQQCKYAYSFLIFPHPVSPYVQIRQFLNIYSYLRSYDVLTYCKFIADHKYGHIFSFRTLNVS